MIENTEMIAAALGAFVGGGISALIQVAIFWRESKQQQVDERELFRAKILNLYLHVGKTKESLERISELCDKAKQRLSSSSIKHLSLCMDSFYPVVSSRDLQADELYFMVKHTKDIDVSSIHRFLGDANVMMELVKKFRDDKEKLLPMLPGRFSNGTIEVGGMTEEEEMKVEPFIIHCDMIAKMIVENVNKTKDRGANAMRSVELILDENLGVSMRGPSNFGE